MAVAIGAGCASGSRIGNMWRDETFQSTPLRNLLVISMRSDQLARRLWEDSYVSGLNAYGARATASYKLWPTAIPDTLQVIEAVQRDAYDGVIVHMRAADTQEETWVPGYTRREAVTRQSPSTGAFYTYWRDVDVPGYATTERVANYRTDVWTTGANGRLVWSGSAQTTGTVDAKLIQSQTGKLVLPELSKSGVIAQKQK